MILNERLFLNEAFGNIPNWVKEYFEIDAKNFNRTTRNVQTTYDPYGNEYTKRERRFKVQSPSKHSGGDQVNISFGGDLEDGIMQTSSWSARHANDVYDDNDFVGKEKYSFGIINSLRAKGFDVANLNITEAPVPEKPSDKYLKDPYIPIFLLQTKNTSKVYTKDSNGDRIIKDVHKYQLYIKGVNDNDLNYVVKDKIGKALKSIPMKSLLEHTVKFAYIDTSDKDIWYDPDIIKQRNKNELDDLENNVFNKRWGTSQNFKNKIDVMRKQVDYNPTGFDVNHYSDKFGDWGTYRDLDKSGYITPRVKDIKKNLKNKFGTKVADKLIKEFNDSVSKIENLKKVYSDYIRYSSWEDLPDDFNIQNYKYFNSKSFKNTLDTYNKVISDLEKELNKPQPYMGYVDDYMHDLRNAVKSISEKMPKDLESELQELDWD